MKYRPRINYTESDKALMWDRWQKGDSLHTIARLFDRNHGAIAGILARTGGIRPPSRSRSRLALTEVEREEISRGIVAGHSLRSIAASLGRAPSTVSREVDRNGGRHSYRASKADQAAWRRAHRGPGAWFRDRSGPEIAYRKGPSRRVLRLFRGPGESGGNPPVPSTPGAALPMSRG